MRKIETQPIILTLIRERENTFGKLAKRWFSFRSCTSHYYITLVMQRACYLGSFDDAVPNRQQNGIALPV